MRRAATVAVLVAAAVAAMAASASAHAVYRSSSPPNGEVVKQAPRTVTITFTEQPDPKVSFVQVMNTQGRDVARGPVQPMPGQPLELRIAVGSMPDGVYTVTWRTVSKEDGHTSAGSFSFGVGNVSPGRLPSAS